jgi:hypothetical protein
VAKVTDLTRSKKLPNISKKKDTRFSKKIVTLVVVLNVIFTILFLYAFIKTSAEPTGLIAAWFSFSTGELWMLSGIKKTELKNSQNDNSDRSEG